MIEHIQSLKLNSCSTQNLGVAALRFSREFLEHILRVILTGGTEMPTQDVSFECDICKKEFVKSSIIRFVASRNGSKEALLS